MTAWASWLRCRVPCDYPLLDSFPCSAHPTYLPRPASGCSDAHVAAYVHQPLHPHCYTLDEESVIVYA
eukprot:scaffold239445_cov32-Tisochrysis_lutea.AAC.1